MTKWFRIVGRMTLESMPLCGLIALVNPSLILLGTPTYIFEADSWFILGGMFFVSSLTLGVLLSSAPVRWQPWIISSLRALFALAFIITVFYPKGGHRLDGVIPEEPSLRNIVFLYIIYILAFITLLFAIYRRKQAMQRVHLVILLVCIAVVGYSIYDGSQKTWVAGQKQLTSAAGEMSYGKGKNIVFILADMLQGSTIEQFFSLNAENARPFEGFTVFTRATSPFPFTNYSLPALLSGKLYAADGAPDVRENLEAAHSDSFIIDAFKEGYDIFAVGLRHFPMYQYQFYFSPYHQKSKFDAMLLCDLGLTRLTKKSGILRDFFGQHEELIHLKNEGVSIFDGLSMAPVGTSQNKLVIIHNFIPHTPVYFKKNGLVHSEPKHDLPGPYLEETAFFMQKLSHLLQHLRDLNVYDEALIIIAGDHGHFVGVQESLYTEFPGAEDFDGVEFGNWARAACMYNPAILMKPPRASSALVITRDSFCLTDLREMINAYLKDDFAFFGNNFTQDASLKGPRKIVVFHDGWKNSPYNSARDHVILENRGNASMLPGLLIASRPDGVAYRLGTIYSPPNELMLSRWLKEDTGAWLTNRTGRVLLKPVDFNKQEYVIKMEATGLVSEIHPKQLVRVKANGVDLGMLTVTEAKQEISISLPDSVVKQNSESLLIEFIPQNAVSPKEVGLWDYPRPISIYIHSFAIM